MASPLVFLRRSGFSFVGGLLPDSLQSTAPSRSSLRLRRACSRAYGAGEGPAAKLSARERRMERTKLLRRNKRDPALEKAARAGTRKLIGTFVLWTVYTGLCVLVSISLEEVQREWWAHRGLDQLQTAGTHFNLYQDLYGGRVFRPLGFMEVAYGERRVHRGTILTPSEVCV